jgi:hypothetical protein
MKKILAALTIAMMLAPWGASAQERTGDAALGGRCRPGTDRPRRWCGGGLHGGTLDRQLVGTATVAPETFGQTRREGQLQPIDIRSGSDEAIATLVGVASIEQPAALGCSFRDMQTPRVHHTRRRSGGAAAHDAQLDAHVGAQVGDLSQDTGVMWDRSLKTRPPTSQYRRL